MVRNKKKYCLLWVHNETEMSKKKNTLKVSENENLNSIRMNMTM